MNNTDREESLTLEILETIENNSKVTQRRLANQLGVALGLANAYLKRSIKKGLVKVDQIPPNRYLYYLTPKGFTEKSRLTAQYLSTSFDFYRRASQSCASIFDECKKKHYQNILLFGVSELAEIASLRATEQGIKIKGVLQSKPEKKKFLGMPVWSSIEEIKEFDACVITSLDDTTELLASLEQHISRDRIFVPDILDIKRNKN